MTLVSTRIWGRGTLTPPRDLHYLSVQIMHVCVCVYVSMRVNISACVCVYASMCVHRYMCVYKCLCTCVSCACMHVHV